jgi:hypothetical protein
MKFENPFTGKKAKVFEICYWAVYYADENKIPYPEVDADETSDVPQSISKIDICNSSIDTNLKVNGVDTCPDNWEP